MERLLLEGIFKIIISLNTIIENYSFIFNVFKITSFELDKIKELRYIYFFETLINSFFLPFVMLIFSHEKRFFLI